MCNCGRKSILQDIWNRNPDYIRGFYPNITYEEFEMLFIDNSEEDLLKVLDSMPPEGAVVRKVDPDTPEIPEEETNNDTAPKNPTGSSVADVFNSAFGAVGNIATFLNSQNSNPPAPQAPAKNDTFSTIIYVFGGIILAIGLYLIIRK